METSANLRRTYFGFNRSKDDTKFGLIGGKAGVLKLQSQLIMCETVPDFKKSYGTPIQIEQVQD